MFDWTAKITRLLELPGLSLWDKSAFNSVLRTWQSFGIPSDRQSEQRIELILQLVAEARTTKHSSHFNGVHDVSFWAEIEVQGEMFPIQARGATPAQALCDAILAAFEEVEDV